MKIGQQDRKYTPFCRQDKGQDRYRWDHKLAQVTDSGETLKST